LAAGNMQALNFGEPLYDWLASASALFPRTFEQDAEDRLRRAACLLVGIGKGLHPDHRADLVFSDVLYAPLAGLTHKERAYLALMLYSSYRGSSATPNDAAIDYHLMEREKTAARVYGTAMRLGAVISGRTADLLSDFSLTGDESGLSLTVKTGEEAMLNRRGVLRLKKLADMIGVSARSNWTVAGGDDNADSDAESED
jgi:exopolyphosphatase/guanosine-5'-triphosphate,3'-diphosphate pyrophosphatase